MGAAEVIHLAAGGQALARVVADGLEHPEAPTRVAEQALVDQ